jgi:hypothetical protein
VCVCAYISCVHPSVRDQWSARPNWFRSSYPITHPSRLLYSCVHLVNPTNFAVDAHTCTHNALVRIVLPPVMNIGQYRVSGRFKKRRCAQTCQLSEVCPVRTSVYTMCPVDTRELHAGTLCMCIRYMHTHCLLAYDYGCAILLDMYRQSKFSSLHTTLDASLTPVLHSPIILC